MHLKELMTRDFKAVAKDATVREAAELMRDLDIGILPVLEENQLVGTVTDRDITIRATASGMAPSETPVSSIMSAGVVFGHEDDDEEVAARLMEQKQLRRLFVLNREDRCVGVVSLGDLAVRSHNPQLGAEVLHDVSQPAA